ncbi:hypothetical protein NL108_016727 [Boleophthalmus pectinirostris]|nr:hypothetical protein NL108_016727 [Boleophthalmus pectinirostris]
MCSSFKHWTHTLKHRQFIHCCMFVLVQVQGTVFWRQQIVQQLSPKETCDCPAYTSVRGRRPCSQSLFRFLLLPPPTHLGLLRGIFTFRLLVCGLKLRFPPGTWTIRITIEL